MLKTILCVDDDPITLMLCKKVIKKAEFSEDVLFANNGQEAFELIQSLVNKKQNDTEINLPQLIFLDLNMPVKNGWEFLDLFNTTISNEFLETKVIILSSTIDPSDYNKAKQYDIVSHFLSKPITVEMLENLKPIYS
ncbi:response regulator [Flavobacterium lacus]|uniref:CheY-like chemotaxis protein n=1 Tax=Flavobacterium lacus TaxID=1353778 RepID=A0A328WVG8_9FLAO|nr:response regulator [Flavobacterium lacus]RAR47298.1 CheY-like chemotaxis protein [Flavobacterium lacus]